MVPRSSNFSVCLPILAFFFVSFLFHSCHHDECESGQPIFTPAIATGMATHSSILAWRIPWTEEPGGLQSVGYSPGGRQESDTTEATEHTRPPGVVTSHQRCVIPFSASSQQAGHGCSQVRVSAVAPEKNSVQSFPLNERGPIN